MKLIEPPPPDQVLPWIRATGDRLLVIFKNSPSCGASRVAYRAFEQYLETAGDVPADYLVVDVLDERPVSQAIARATGVVHESPQLLLVKNGMTVWHTSHISINPDSLKKQIGRFSAAPAGEPSKTTPSA